MCTPIGVKHFVNIFIILSLNMLGMAYCHGRLIEPPSRASMWRFGFNNPQNYDDNQMYCGGFQVHYYVNNGKCGICGDAWNGPREHEAGGRYANGIIGKAYTIGQEIEVSIQITANHLGWMEFSLCAIDDPQKKVTQDCLDRNRLELAGSHQQRIPVLIEMIGIINIRLKLPKQLKCRQCVLQWKYNAGNSWGLDSETGKSCAGCGQQEQFYACSDISILDSAKDPYSEIPIMEDTKIQDRVISYNEKINPLTTKRPLENLLINSEEVTTTPGLTLSNIFVRGTGTANIVIEEDLISDATTLPNILRNDLSLFQKSASSSFSEPSGNHERDEHLIALKTYMKPNRDKTASKKELNNQNVNIQGLKTKFILQASQSNMSPTVLQIQDNTPKPKDGVTETFQGAHSTNGLLYILFGYIPNE